MAASARSVTSTSLSPLPRKMPNETTVWLLTRANDFGFSQESVTVAMSDSVTLRPPDSGISSASRSAIFLAPPSVRIAWSRLAEIAAAAGQVDIGGAQRAVDVAGGDAERVQPVRVELDLDLARHAAIAVDAGDALQALQLADDRVVDEPGQLLDGHGRRGDGIGQDRLALDVDAAHDRLVGGRRQVGADALDRRP